MKPRNYAYLSAYIFMCCVLIQIETKCLHPDVPENGNYTSEHSNTLQPGDKIIYSCRKGFALSGMDRRVCKTSGQWSDHAPFCDPAAKLRNPIIKDSRMDSNFFSGSSMIDGNTETCSEWKLSKNDYIKVPLAEKLIIRTVRIFFKKGPISIQIFAGLDKNMVLMSNHTSYLESDQWVDFECEGNLFSDLVMIEVTDSNRLKVCEIEVYGKTEEGCDQSPSRKILNGRLEVSRTKAVLICDDDYKIEGSSRLVCEENNTWIGGTLICEEILCGVLPSLEHPGVKWIYPNWSKKLTIGTIAQMVCTPGYKMVGEPHTISCQKNGTWTTTVATCVEEVNEKAKIKRIVVGVVAVVVSIIIIALLATVIYFIRKLKKKEVVVVYQPKSEEEINYPQGGEYELPRYDILDNKPPELPSTPRPLAKLSTMSRGGDTESTAWKATFVKSPPEKPVEGMKPSTIYGS